MPEVHFLWGNLGEAQHFACDDAYRQFFETALRFAGTQIRLNPTEAGMHSRSAVYRSYLGDVDKADKLMERALDLAPEDSFVAYNQAVVSARLGRKERASAANACVEHPAAG